MADAPFAVMGYEPRLGRSSYLVVCACGQLFDFYVWSGRKLCPGCHKLYVYRRTGIAVLVDATSKPKYVDQMGRVV